MSVNTYFINLEAKLKSLEKDNTAYAKTIEGLAFQLNDVTKGKYGRDHYVAEVMKMSLIIKEQQSTIKTNEARISELEKGLSEVLEFIGKTHQDEYTGYWVAPLHDLLANKTE